ncbi:hypothetical protein [Spirosoma foliorum]|uniref:Uncharacterized protein n=1 Tax=Spirosoma foliorum TaxID=2710596 RepID=A0A7G5H1D4_9BACT|nr:hypothetical protein [Spirosoma foliorum]QMW04926.1 hypothetical protein H3H32_08520 [Spirosoma foliorum]
MTKIQGGDTLTQLGGKGIQLTVDKLVVIEHGPGDIVSVNENNIQPLMYPLSLCSR